MLLIIQPIRPVLADNPTPTPPASREFPGSEHAPAAKLCRLEPGTACDFPKRADLTGSSLPAWSTYPVNGAQGIPTYKLISVTFDREMDFNTLHTGTFEVRQAGVQLDGSVRYIEASKIAIFYPDRLLQPGAEYTARLTKDVRYASGEPLVEELVWRFTTAAAVSPAGDLTGEAGMNVYFGDLHSHSSYSDGQGTPADAFTTARANGLDFFALTDHDIMLTETEWQDILTQAQAATVNGVFVALRGFEFTHAKGHLNVFDTGAFVRGNDPAFANLANFYTWLVNQPGAVAQFNHPRQDAQYDWNFNNFAYQPAADLKIVLRELSNAEQFFLSLNSGWHVGTLSNSDTHEANWGSKLLMGVAAPTLTEADILAALRARCTFFVSPSDRNLALVMQANGYWMGSAVPETTALNFVITAYDPDPQGQPLKMALYDNGLRIANATLPSSTAYQWRPAIAATLGHYYYAEAYRDGWYYPAYSSPIWVERPPLAEAGSHKFVAPGATATLDGRASYDPDGDALAYSWAQESGASGTLAQAATAQPAFTAPATLGDVTLRLMVTDPGGLSGSDTTVVTVTDKPILAISKKAPATTAPGEPITYTLTVTNCGLDEAVGVVITDVLPVGATYVSGGTQQGNIVSWSGLNLPGNGGNTQVSFVVTAASGLANARYGAACTDCIPAQGQEIIFTNATQFYLPIVAK
ncbi:MAG: CehA/McbA family metallohydrolase [Chloroflexota bacterium]